MMVGTSGRFFAPDSREYPALVTRADLYGGGRVDLIYAAQDGSTGDIRWVGASQVPVVQGHVLMPFSFAQAAAPPPPPPPPVFRA